MGQGVITDLQQVARNGSVWVAGKVLNQLIRWIGNIRFADGLGIVMYSPDGIQISLDIEAIAEEVEKLL